MNKNNLRNAVFALTAFALSIAGLKLADKHQDPSQRPIEPTAGQIGLMPNVINACLDLQLKRGWPEGAFTVCAENFNGSVQENGGGRFSSEGVPSRAYAAAQDLAFALTDAGYLTEPEGDGLVQDALAEMQAQGLSDGAGGSPERP